MLNPDLERLRPYPFEQLASLFAGLHAPKGLKAISLSIGEPQHSPPQFVLDALTENIDLIAKYPTTRGTETLRKAIASWLSRRFSLRRASIDHETQIIPVNGTREAIFAAVQAAAERTTNGLVVMPNPFYQIYEGAAFMAGLTPHYLPITESGQPDYYAVPDTIWKDCQFCFICTPGNPTGTVIDEATLAYLIGKAQMFDFWLASDECYSEIYRAVPPPGLLEVCSTIGNTDFKKCMVFHSLSKRSNLPGLRSGFVAGDADFIRPFLKYRTYHGCSMSMAVQKASELAWADDNDILIAVTCKPYRSEVVEAVTIAKDQGMTIVALSDSPASPIICMADHGFIVSVETPQFFPSSVSIIALLETLLSFVIAVASDEIPKRVETFHKRRHQLGLYYTEEK